jgi:hypothetical protein
MKTLSIGYTTGSYTDVYGTKYPLKNVFVLNALTLTKGIEDPSVFGKTGIVDLMLPVDDKEVNFLLEVNYELDTPCYNQEIMQGTASYVVQIKDNNVRITKGNPLLDISVVLIH